MLSSLPLLSTMIWGPIVWGLLFLCTRFSESCIRFLASLGAVFFFSVALFLYNSFNIHADIAQFQEHLPWLPLWGVSYSLSVDGLSLLFLLLNAFLLILIVFSTHFSVKKKVGPYLFCFFLMAGLMNGAFSATDGLLFYIFFEASLIPLYLIIGTWGGPQRVYAAFKFFLYTLSASVLFLIALIFLSRLAHNSFSLEQWSHLFLPFNVQCILFLLCFFAFAVKIPMFPLHTWLPNAHVEAPTGGSVILAALALKLGAYGFLRFCLPLFPQASRFFAPYIFVLSIVAVVYIGCVAIVQNDMKKLIAYSSISHMGFVTFGLFSHNASGLLGALFQMISHGFVSAALFFCVGILYDRVHSRQIADYGGVIHSMPYFSAFFVLFALANCGLPGTSGFVGEFLVLLSSAQHNLWATVFLSSSLVLSAAYSLWLVKRVIFGPVNTALPPLQPLTSYEFFNLVVLAIATIVFGIFPSPIADVFLHSVHNLARMT